jgi:asparagine synthase (glutamine-hydrolysing)
MYKYFILDMCGIWATLGAPLPSETAKQLVHTLRARGPEGSRIVQGGNFTLGFTRLAINGVDSTTIGQQPSLHNSGMQPMQHNTTHWVCNGELYNYKDLANRFSIPLQTGSDCEVLGPLFQTLGTQTDAPTLFRSLDGVFSTVLVDTQADLAFVARDPYGVRPLFVGYILGKPEEFGPNQASIMDASGNRVPIATIVFASEMKALPLADCAIVESFPPGHYAAYDLRTLNRIGFEPYHTVPWLKHPQLADKEVACQAIRQALTEAVQKRLMAERPIAALLSGGVDSSLIAALAQQELKKRGAPPLKTFSIGFKGSEDLRFARYVAEHIGSDHHEIVLTPDEFFEAIPDVIRAIESFDITTVRASVGNYLVSKAIAQQSDCKVVFNGDGSDEVFGGYLYFYKAPSDEAFEAESGRLLQDIHYFDVLRSDRSISSHGLEARTPFLDKQFVDVARAVSTALRRPIPEKQCEKYCLRWAFNDTDLLPADVLWRRKEAFSDGVSGQTKSWYTICQEKALEEVGPEWETKAGFFKHLPPQTAEAYYYRSLFHRFYGSVAERSIVPYHWLPKWCGNVTDPSARTFNIYKSST